MCLIILYVEVMTPIIDGKNYSFYNFQLQLYNFCYSFLVLIQLFVICLIDGAVVLVFFTVLNQTVCQHAKT